MIVVCEPVTVMGTSLKSTTATGSPGISGTVVPAIANFQVARNRYLSSAVDLEKRKTAQPNVQKIHKSCHKNRFSVSSFLRIRFTQNAEIVSLFFVGGCTRTLCSVLLLYLDIFPLARSERRSGSHPPRHHTRSYQGKHAMHNMPLAVGLGPLTEDDEVCLSRQRTHPSLPVPYLGVPRWLVILFQLVQVRLGQRL